MLIEGERDKELLNNANKTNEFLQTKITVLETKQTVTNLFINKIVDQNKALIASNKKANKAVKFYKITTIIGSGIAGILTILLLI